MKDKKVKIKKMKRSWNLWLVLCIAAVCLFTIPAERVSAAAPKLNKTRMNLYVGGSQKLAVKNTRAKVTWKSSKTKVATVNSKGVVKGVSAGTAKITAAVSGKKLSCTVKVTNRDANAADITAETADGGDFILGESTLNVSFKLDAASTNVKAQILDLIDTVLYTKTFLTCKKGVVNQFSWNGKNNSGQLVRNTTCKIKITAGKTETVSSAYFTVATADSTGFSGGNGSQSNPYLIENLEQLRKVSLHMTRCFKQMSDIDGASTAFEAMGGDDLPFTGSYDGNGHTISNLMIKDGIFNLIGESGKVENLTFDSCSVTKGESYFIGVLAAKSSGAVQGCTFKNCSLNLTKGNQTCVNIGAVCGQHQEKGSISNCSADKIDIASPEGDGYGYGAIGGLVGANFGRIIAASVNDCTIISAGGYARDHYSGGIAGVNESTGIITNSQVQNGMVQATGAYDSLHHSHNYAGGITGRNFGQILNCVADAVATMAENQGVIAGKNEGVVTNN